MDRREFAKNVGAVALSSTILRSNGLAFEVQNVARQRQSTESLDLPREVAGIKLVDSKIAKEATELAREVSAPYLFNHAARTFLFGALAGRAMKLHFDDELLYLACILHDLGLTERYMGDLPFEIQGAQAASQFLVGHGLSSERAAIVWDGIAMHPSAIGHYKQPEIALVGAGAGADVIAPDSNQISPAERDEVTKAFPRLRFKTAFIQTCADVVRRHPRGASHSFMRDIGERYVQGFHPPNICDAIEKSPFSE
jgi:HD domain